MRANEPDVESRSTIASSTVNPKLGETKTHRSHAKAAVAPLRLRSVDGTPDLQRELPYNVKTYCPGYVRGRRRFRDLACATARRRFVVVAFFMEAGRVVIGDPTTRRLSQQGLWALGRYTRRSKIMLDLGDAPGPRPAHRLRPVGRHRLAHVSSLAI